MCSFTFTFTFTTIQARPLYEAYVFGSVSVLTRCDCSVFNVHTPVLKALRFGAVTREAGKAFHCSRVLGNHSCIIAENVITPVKSSNIQVITSRCCTVTMRCLNCWCCGCQWFPRFFFNIKIHHLSLR